MITLYHKIDTHTQKKKKVTDSRNCQKGESKINKHE